MQETETKKFSLKPSTTLVIPSILKIFLSLTFSVWHWLLSYALWIGSCRCMTKTLVMLFVLGLRQL